MGENVSRAWDDFGGEDGPTLRFYRKFEEDWQTYTADVKQELGDFLRLLQDNPCSPAILEKCERNEHYFAYRLDRCDGVVYWELELEGEFVSITKFPDSIYILAIEFDI